MSSCGRPSCYITDLHTHQTGTDGVIGQVCEHGSLARSCYICELEAEREALKIRLEEAFKKQDYLRSQPDLNTEHEKNLRKILEGHYEVVIKERDALQKELTRLSGKTGFCLQCEAYARERDRYKKVLKKIAFEGRDDFQKGLLEVRLLAEEALSKGGAKR